MGFAGGGACDECTGHIEDYDDIYCGVCITKRDNQIEEMLERLTAVWARGAITDMGELYVRHGSGDFMETWEEQSDVYEQKVEKLEATLSRIKQILLDAPREGRDKDEPEGARTIRLSDTLAFELLNQIDEATK